jgi:hypothetical protein
VKADKSRGDFTALVAPFARRFARPVQTPSALERQLKDLPRRRRHSSATVRDFLLRKTALVDVSKAPSVLCDDRARSVPKSVESAQNRLFFNFTV